MAAKELTPEEQFLATDWSEQESIMKLFPAYMQVQQQLRKENKKNVSKAVDIENFTLKTPFGDQTLLKGTELKIEAGKRQCLFGANSTGKTLLFENMSSGKIKEFPKHLHVHHCKELENHELGDTVLGQVVNSYPYRNILLKCIKHLEGLLAAETGGPEGEKREAMATNLDWLKFSANTIRAYDAEDRCSKMLRVLGFDDLSQQKLCSALSGGLRMRVALCMAFFIEADLLLLDEPTNHLDFPSVLWLENRLRGYRGSFLLVSHDRELLNNVCQSVCLIEDQQLIYYPISFKEFEKKKAIDDKKKSDDIEKFLLKNRNADPSTQIGALKASKQQWVEKYNQRQIALAGKFTFPVATPLDNPDKLPAQDIILIDLKDVTFSYDTKIASPIFIFPTPISFRVTASTRVGVMGPNGAGKSTLLKLLTHKLTAVTGSVTHHPNYILAYFGQHSTAELDLELTALEFMEKQFPDEQTGTLKQHLGKTGVYDTLANTRMKGLSFSQRSCVIFAKLTFVCPHLLIMDEPTNFLDLESVDSLIGACNKYAGALLLVSHNRDFLRKCAKQYLSIVPGQFALFDDLKSAERATYTFIAEMEEGTASGASLKDALKNNPGGGTVTAAQAGKKEEEKKAAGPIGATAGAAVKTGAAAAPVAAAADWQVGDKVSALWTDGKWYEGIVKKVVTPKEKWAVTYSAYGNTATLTAKQIKKFVAAPAAAPAAGAKAAPAAAAKGGKK